MAQRRLLRYSLLLAAGALLGTVGSIAVVTWRLLDPRSFVPMPRPEPVPGRSVAIVPFADFPPERLDRLVDHVRSTYRITPIVLPAIDLPEDAYTRSRGQYYFEGLYRHMRDAYREQGDDENVVMIGLTRADMYVRQETWAFAFTYRSQGRFAVVATGRSDRLPAPGVPDVGPDQATADARLRKLLARTLGLLYYRLDFRVNPKSVLHPPLWGIQELDAMSEAF